MNELVKVTTSENGEQLVSGRELHEYLEVKTQYTKWFDRMKEYGFVENVDFTSFSQKSLKPDGGRPEQDHALKLDMAKEISMIQRTEKGKRARQYFIAIEKKSNKSIESEIKRMNAEARLKNANSRLAKTFVELSKDATSEVNKALLQSKAVEVLTGEKLIEMPTLKEKLLDCDQIAKRLSVLSKNGKPHGTAVSQIIQQYIPLEENESEIVPEAVNGWSGSVVKYSESVINKVEAWLEDNNYPSVIKGTNKNYHVAHGDIA